MRGDESQSKERVHLEQMNLGEGLCHTGNEK